MKKENTAIKITSGHRLRFTANMDPGNILTPVAPTVKSEERIKLTAKVDKLGQKASREAVRRLLDFPNHVAEPQTGAKLLSLVLLAQVSPLYAAQAGTALPSIQIGGALRFPESIGDLLRAVQGGGAVVRRRLASETALGPPAADSGRRCRPRG